MSTRHSENHYVDTPADTSTGNPFGSSPETSMGRWHPQDHSGISDTDPSLSSRRNDPKELQQAIDALVTRIAAARANAAARNRAADAPSEDQPESAAAQEASHEAQNDRQPQQPVRASSGKREVVELETRLRQIADLAGPSVVADIGADIAALRGKIDNLSHVGDILSDRTGVIQAELSQLRETLTQISPPVADRFSALDNRLDQIGTALANRQLTPEAQAAVEHSCSYILDSIAQLERVAQQSRPPEGVWDEIAVASRTLTQLPTVDNLAALENHIQSVSGQLGELVAQNQMPSDFARLDRRLSDLAIATASTAAEIRRRPVVDPAKINADLEALAEEIRRRPTVDPARINVDLAALAEEIRRRPAVDPAKINADLEALADKIDQWRGQATDVGGVDAKLDDISRRVDSLARLDYAPVLWKIMEGLRTLAEADSDGATGRFSEDLGDLRKQLVGADGEQAYRPARKDPEGPPADQTALTSDGESLPDQANHAGNKVPAKSAGGDVASASNIAGADFVGGHGDDDHEVAKRLATRFAPVDTFVPASSDEPPAKTPYAGDLSAFQAVKDALDALGPMIKGRSESEGHGDSPAGRNDGASPAEPGAGEVTGSAFASQGGDPHPKDAQPSSRSETAAPENAHGTHSQPTGGWSGTTHATQQVRGPSPWRPATVAVLEAKGNGY